jgi:predicted peptidase
MKSVFACTAIFLLVQSPEPPGLSLYQKKQFTRQGQTLLYRILYPAVYDSSRAYPLIIFLHGAANRGSDNESQLQNGGSLFLADSNRKKFPAIVIFPQCPAGLGWSAFKFGYDTVHKRVVLSFPLTENQSPVTALVKALADSLSVTGKADSGRIYIGGLSLGGFGTYDMIERYPGYFAAAFPICGGGDTSTAPRIAAAGTAVWIFHGEKDPLVSVKYARQYYQALRSAHANVRYTEYPGVRHNCWDNAFKEPELLPWLFSRQKIVQQRE